MSGNFVHRMTLVYLLYVVATLSETETQTYPMNRTVN